MKMVKKTLIVLSLCFGATVHGAERKNIIDVDIDEFSSDTQVAAAGAGDSHVAIAWWIPSEFWEAILSRDTSTNEADKKTMLDALSGVSLLCIVQADVTDFGAFNFYPKDEIAKHMTIEFSAGDGQSTSLRPVTKVSPDLDVVLSVFKPILATAMGNMGSNMHFYVLDDQAADQSRLMDPYKPGVLNVKLRRSDDAILPAAIEMPINALFVPRTCPNGKPAHVSWRYCPWFGSKLPE